MQETLTVLKWTDVRRSVFLNGRHLREREKIKSIDVRVNYQSNDMREIKVKKKNIKEKIHSGYMTQWTTSHYPKKKKKISIHTLRGCLQLHWTKFSITKKLDTSRNKALVWRSTIPENTLRTHAHAHTHAHTYRWDALCYLHLYLMTVTQRRQLNEGTNWEQLLIIPVLTHLSAIN